MARSWSEEMLRLSRSSASAGWASVGTQIRADRNAGIRHEESLAATAEVIDTLNDGFALLAQGQDRIINSIDRNALLQQEATERQTQILMGGSFANWRQGGEDGRFYKRWEAGAHPFIRLTRARDLFVRRRVLEAWEAARRSEPPRPETVGADDNPKNGFGCIAVAGVALLIALAVAGSVLGSLSGKDLSGGHALLQLAATLMTFVVVPAAVIALVAAVVTHLRRAARSQRHGASQRRAKQAEAEWNRWYQDNLAAIGAAPDQSVDWVERPNDREFIAYVNKVVTEAPMDHPSPERLPLLFDPRVRAARSNSVVERAIAELRAEQDRAFTS